MTTSKTGRIICARPNLQNLPIRTEEGRRIRDAFVSRVALLGFDGTKATFEPLPDIHAQMAAIFGFGAKP